jgi:hypothetical protein
LTSQLVPAALKILIMVGPPAPQDAAIAASPPSHQIIDDQHEVTPFHRKFLSCFPFLHSETTKRQTFIRSNEQVPAQKPTLKPILHRHLGNMESRVEASPYSWPHDGTLDQKTTALVVIDMQRDCKSILLSSAIGFQIVEDIRWNKLGNI